ncbi:MAG: Rho termination factor N-terminal domain-containing protein [Chloroflexi bacterium]|nr:Rho termination factor N-terminal domain-containing protein [Chloroflexota bacterium]
MSTRLTVDQLEHMKTHELADLLANVVLLLRRMPNVEWRALASQLPGDELFAIEEVPESRPAEAPTLTAETLKKKTVAELKKLADELHLPISSKIKKDELISKLLARQTRNHSEQYAIQDV